MACHVIAAFRSKIGMDEEVVLSLDPSERIFLESFYQKTQGDLWIDKTGWNFTEEGYRELCRLKWYGVMASPREVGGRRQSRYCNIQAIRLSHNNLNGTLPEFKNLQVNYPS